VDTRAQGVSLDVWKTLIKSNPEYKPRRDQVVAERLNADVREVSRAIRSADVRCDEIADATGRQLGPCERLTAMLSTLRCDDCATVVERLALEIQELFLEYPVLLKEGDILHSLGELRSHRRLALTSNTGFIDAAHMREALRGVGVLALVDVSVFSSEVGAAKPDRRIFDATARSLGLGCAAIVHVGDSFAADYQGALRAGMRAVWLTPESGDTSVDAAPSIKVALERGLLT
jgi:putative hydrolase of the HAD superfamily